jgi:hypothetical protein
LLVTRSFSKISMKPNPAFEIADILVSSVPDRQTVAIE